MLILAGIETIIMAVLFLASAAIAYSGYQQAKKAAQRAAASRSSLDKNRGALYQTKAAASPRRIIIGRHRIGGLEAYFGNSGSENKYLHFILIWSDGPNVGVEKIFFDDREVSFDGSGVSTGYYAGKVIAKHRNGGTDNLTPIAEAVAQLPGWGETDLLLGICYTWIRFEFNETVFPKGIPSISAVVMGRNDIVDVRTDVTGYTTNVALAFNFYMTLARMGGGLDYATEVDEASLIEAANVCDIDVPRSVGGDEKKYTFNGILNLEEEPESIIDSFRTAMAGAAVYIGGRWKYYAGQWVEPTFEITEDMIVGPVKLNTKNPKNNHFNTVTGVFATEAVAWQPTDFIAYKDEDALEDDGEELLDDIELVNTNSPTMCRRIAKIHCKRSQLPRRVSVPVSVRGMRAQPGLPVLFTLPRWGFNQTPVDVLEYGMNISDNKITIQLMLNETAESIYDWTTAEDKAADFNVGDGPSLGYPQCSPPIFTPGSGTYETSILVGLSSVTIGGLMYYQIKPDTDPLVEADWILYSEPVEVAGSDDTTFTMYAKTTKVGLADSAAASAEYHFEDAEPPP